MPYVVVLVTNFVRKWIMVYWKLHFDIRIVNDEYFDETFTCCLFIVLYKVEMFVYTLISAIHKTNVIVIASTKMLKYNMIIYHIINSVVVFLDLSLSFDENFPSCSSIHLEIYLPLRQPNKRLRPEMSQQLK